MEVRSLLLAALDRSDQGLAIFDRSLRLVTANPAFPDLFSVPAPLCEPGTRLRDLLELKAKRGDFGPADIDRICNGLTTELEFERPGSPGGRSFHERFVPVDDGMVVLASDKTFERRLAIAEATVARQKKFPEFNPMPVMRFAPDGSLSFANRASGPLLARIQCKVGDTAPDRWQKWFEQARTAGHPIERSYDKDDAYFSLLLCPIDTGETNIYGRDITERVRHERELRAAKEAADQANVTKSQFLANMSHELRTPMNAIMGFTRIVMRKGKPVLPERQYQNLEKILVSAQHLLSLINDILDLSKIEAGRMDVYAAEFEFQQLCDLCLKTVEPMAAEGVELVCDVPADIPAFVTDEAKTKQILINLLSNAVKFTKEGSVRLDTRIEDGIAHISVTDTGVGIPADALGTVFEEFQQVDGSSTREYGGTGLGLAICQRLAQLLGGEITVTSEVGVGSTFTLHLPVRHGTAPTADEAPVADLVQTLEPAGAKACILAIDDDPDAAYFVQESLSEAGYEVVIARDGADGLAKARSLKPLAITLDVKMADMDGWQVLHHLKSDPETRDIPVVLLTVVDERPLAYRLGATDYLLKPFDRDAFMQSLTRIMGTRGDLLVVDDDPDVHDLVGQLLEEEEVTIRCAYNGQEAMEALKAKLPDALFLDLMMPVMDGFHVLHELRSDPTTAGVPVVVFTAKILTSEEKEFLAERVTHVFTKQGLDRDALLAELRTVMQGAEA